MAWSKIVASPTKRAGRACRAQRGDWLSVKCAKLAMQCARFSGAWSYLCASCHGRSYNPVTCRLPTTLHLHKLWVRVGHRCGQWWGGRVVGMRACCIWMCQSPRGRRGWIMMDVSGMMMIKKISKKNKLYKKLNPVFVLFLRGPPSGVAGARGKFCGGRTPKVAHSTL